MSRRGLYHSLIIDGLVTVRRGCCVKDLSTCYNTIDTTYNTNTNVACVCNKACRRISLAVVGALKGVKKVIYSKTGPSYTTGVTASISTTLVTFRLDVRGGDFLPKRNVVGSSVRRAVGDVKCVKEINVHAASARVLGMVVSHTSVGRRYWA